MDVTLRRAGPLDCTFVAPPSKSFSHRALVAAALADGESTVCNPLESGDTWVTRRALESMGIGIRGDGDRLLVHGRGGALSCPAGHVIDAGESGTSMRLLCSVALLCGSPVTLTGSGRMKERPMGPLADALRALGGRVEFLEKEGYPPVRVSGELVGGRALLDAGMSSQFASSVLLVAPLAREDVTLSLRGHVASKSYLDVTVSVMEAFSARVERDGYRRFHVPAGRGYRPARYRVEGDYSSASYFFALAAACGGRVVVRNLNPRSCQGDRGFLRILEGMGCRVQYGEDSVEVMSTGDLEGVDVDMASMPDTVQTLCVLASRARGVSRISGVAHLRYKESDRLAETARLLSALGAEVRVRDGTITVVPGPLRGGEIDPGSDHRTAMSFAVLGLATGNLKIKNAECVSKSFPGFWEQLRVQGLL
ncbi:MAG: 3-phosphoshikimate 1-carboxyvinyltransferase [Methanolinea sp.]|nr:3-phosphoshikimate 1-carboxyvinyltransferase [Methanolinea sp.]